MSARQERMPENQPRDDDDGNVVDFVKAYAMQEIVDPLKAAPKWIGFGIGGTFAFGIGLIFASGGVGSVLGGIVAHWLMRRWPVGRIMIWATWIWVLTWIPYALAPNAVLLGLVNVLGFLIVPVYLVTQYSYRLTIIPDALLGRVNSVFRLIAFGSGPLGLALAGFLLQDFGPIRTVWIIVAPQILLCIAATCYAPLQRATFPPMASALAD